VFYEKEESPCSNKTANSAALDERQAKFAEARRRPNARVRKFQMQERGVKAVNEARSSNVNDQRNPDWISFTREHDLKSLVGLSRLHDVVFTPNNRGHG
jgi:hypothetical protein